MSHSNLQYFVLICDKKYKSKYIDLLASYEGACINATYAKGSAKAGALAKALGFEAEEKKVVLSCVMPYDKACELTDVLAEQYGFKNANTGIAFGVSLGGICV